jgi:hypothetical protein
MFLGIKSSPHRLWRLCWFLPDSIIVANAVLKSLSAVTVITVTNIVPKDAAKKPEKNLSKEPLKNTSKPVKASLAMLPDSKLSGTAKSRK